MYESLVFLHTNPLPCVFCSCYFSAQLGGRITGSISQTMTATRTASISVMYDSRNKGTRTSLPTPPPATTTFGPVVTQLSGAGSVIVDVIPYLTIPLFQLIPIKAQLVGRLRADVAFSSTGTPQMPSDVVTCEVPACPSNAITLYTTFQEGMTAGIGALTLYKLIGNTGFLLPLQAVRRLLTFSLKNLCTSPAFLPLPIVCLGL